MRTKSIAPVVTAICLCVLAESGRPADPIAIVPPPIPRVPHQMPSGGVPAPAASASVPLGGEVLCPPDPCLTACPPACPPARRPGPVPRVRVIMSPPEVVFQQVPGCAQTSIRKCLPNWFSKPSCAPQCGPHEIPQGAPQAVKGGPQGAPQGAPQAATGQAFQTVPVTTYHAVPVTTFQTVPVTTFQTVPVAAAVGVQSVGVQAVGAQAFGVQGFGAGFAGPSAFGAGVFPSAVGGFGMPAAAHGGDVELRLLQALSVIAQQGKAQAQGADCGKSAAAQGAGPQSVEQAETTRQFLELEKRLLLLIAGNTKDIKTNTDNIKKNTDDIAEHYKTLAELEGRIKKLEEMRMMPPPVKPR